jgi:hypothetical protein
MSPTVSIALAVSSIVFPAAVAAALGVLWRRVRALPVDEIARAIENLAERQRAVESLLTRLEQREAARAASAVAPPPGRGPSPAPGASSNAPRRADRGETNAARGPTLIAVPHLAAPAHAPEGSAAADLDRRFGAIWALADSGASADEIARSTGQPIGQVELILGLRRQLNASPTP